MFLRFFFFVFFFWEAAIQIETGVDGCSVYLFQCGAVPCRGIVCTLSSDITAIGLEWQATHDTQQQQTSIRNNDSCSLLQLFFTHMHGMSTMYFVLWQCVCVCLCGWRQYRRLHRCRRHHHTAIGLAVWNGKENDNNSVYKCVPYSFWAFVSYYKGRGRSEAGDGERERDRDRQQKMRNRTWWDTPFYPVHKTDFKSFALHTKHKNEYQRQNGKK